MNLYQAVVTAASWKSEGIGVLVVFSGRIFSARDVQKASTHSVVSMSGGEYSKLFESELRKLSIPVVVSSRVGSGVIMSNSVPCGIAANDLPPQKAAILLRLALTETTDHAEIARMFEKY